MGYYTNYELEIVEGGDYNTDYEEVVAEQVDYNPFEEETKWYHHEKDMVNVSKKHPKVLFKLKGEGEEAGDLWVNYYKDGKSQHCPGVITFDEYDESKLS